MKIIFFVIIYLNSFWISTGYSQIADSLHVNTKKDKIKKGWNLGAVPAIAFDSDLGIKYGAVANVYNYGDGTIYPRYKHSFYLEWSRTTKGSGINQFIYDSEYLIPNIRITAEASLLTEQTLDFYGFNGYESYYNKDLESSISKVYYKYCRELARIKLDFQGKIKGRTFRWMAGIQYNDYELNTVNIDRLNKGKTGSDILPDTSVLYDKYLEWGLIPKDQEHGGKSNMVTMGLVYDTRDNEPNPMKGIWSEAILLYCPAFLANKYSYSKIALTHRQYFTIYKDALNLALRLSYQGKVGGTIPFYMLSYVYNQRQARDGLGGAKTLRGILRNRAIGEDFVFGNLEVRWKFLRTIILNQNIYVALAPFFDFGRITGKYTLSASNLNAEALDYLSEGSAESWHISYGSGLYVAMNQNFVVSFNYGLAANKKDGTNGFYIGLDFLY